MLEPLREKRARPGEKEKREKREKRKKGKGLKKKTRKGVNNIINKEETMSNKRLFLLFLPFETELKFTKCIILNWLQADAQMYSGEIATS